MKTFKKTLSTAVVISAASACALSRGEARLDSLNRAGQVHVFESEADGFNTKTVFYDNGSEVVAFDAQFTPALAEKALSFLRSKTTSPVSYLVITHPNPDKFNGLSVFQKAGAKVIASQATVDAMPVSQAYKKNFWVNVAKMFTEETYPTLGSVDVTFDSTLDIELGNGERLHLSKLQGPGVSVTQTVAFIPAVNALVVGDLVHHEVHAWLEGGIVNGKPTPTIASWIKDLQELQARFRSENPVVYGGRGLAAPLTEATAAQIAYLKKADEIVTRYVTSLGAQRIELMGAEGGKHFANIQKEMESAFPQRGLGYMIQYGVYGLALTK